MTRIARLTVLAALALSALAGAPASATSTGFQVGFSVRNIDPCATCPQFLGGFGYGNPTANVHDPLEVRVIAISNGTGMVELASVDTQGYFAGNQEGPWGSHDARVDAGAALGISPGNIIISSTHSHAAPTIMGIWGTTDPAYLKRVHDQTVAALIDAATNLRPANLYAASADVSDTIISAIEQTDGYQGWRPEGDTPILWARDPITDATLGLYANIPVHADVVNGVGLQVLSADHIGVERALLGADLGGTAVVAMGTLGRQEATVQTDGFAASQRLGTYITNEIERALAHATQITDLTVAAAEQYIVVPGTNPLLAALNYGNAAPGCPCSAEVAWTIDRAITPPYLVGSAFGTWITALRIGNVVYASEPGEAFPEVSAGIRAAFNGNVDVRVVGMAQDQLGYYYPPETYPFTFTNPSDHHVYNASLLLADANVQAHALNARALGFTPAVVHETNQFDDPASTARVGVQWFPTKRESTAATVAITAYTSEAAVSDISSGVLLGEGPGVDDDCPRTIAWNTGGATSGGCGQVLSRTFSGPGVYPVTATVTDARTGALVTWTGTLIVDPALSATTATSGDTLTAGVTGGQGTILAAHWSFDDATAADGIQVSKPGGHGTVTVVDGAGNKATTTF